MPEKVAQFQEEVFSGWWLVARELLLPPGEGRDEGECSVVLG
jgi:hypothetical protein